MTPPRRDSTIAEEGTTAISLRIAYLTGSFPSATHTFFWREIESLRELGVHVDIVSTRSPDLHSDADSWRLEAQEQTLYLLPMTIRDLLRASFTVVRAGPAGWGRTFASWRRADGSLTRRLALLATILVGAKLAQEARRRQWHHVHVGFTEKTADVALYANRLLGLSYSVSQHHSIHVSAGNQEQKWSHARFGTVVSTFLQEQVISWFGGCPPCPVVLVPHGLDLRLFVRRRPYQPWAGKGECRLFSCGRLTAAKGHSEVVRAIAVLNTSGIQCKLRIAGERYDGGEPYLQELRRLIINLDVERQVEFLGNISQDRVRLELEQAHIMVLATHSEGWGSAIAEALAMGVPTVACRAGGVIDTITHGDNGFLAEPGDYESLATFIKSILLNPRLAMHFSCRGTKTIEERFGRLTGPTLLRRCIMDTVSNAAAAAPVGHNVDLTSG